MKKFDANSFYNSFNVTIKVLAESERITKDALRWLSRDCLMLLHYESNKQGDIAPINKVLKVLTPVNKKAWVLFMQEFSGFIYSEKDDSFTRKDKKLYEEKCKAACELLDDPHQNIWTWAERNIKMEKKAFKLETLGKDVKKALEAEDDEGNALYSKADIIRTVLEHGITPDDLIEILQAMDVVEVN